MPYLEQVLLPKVHAELVRLAGDAELIDHLEELLGIGAYAPPGVVAQVPAPPAPPVVEPIPEPEPVAVPVEVAVAAAETLPADADWEAVVAQAEANLQADETQVAEDQAALDTLKAHPKGDSGSGAANSPAA